MSAERDSLRYWRAAVIGAPVFSTLLFSAVSAEASGPIGDNGSAITTSRYAIDLFRGPVFAGSRTTGLGGAYVAIGWDVDGMLQNPAAPAVRPFFSVTDFDYWLGLGLTLPGSLAGMDFFNSGTVAKDGDIADAELFISPAAMLQFGNFGFGVSLELQRYEIGHTQTDTGQSARVFMSFDIAHLQAAYAFDHGSLVLGMGSRILRMSAQMRTDERDTLVPLSSTGTGMEFGVLWKPHRQVFSLGGAFRTGIETTTRTSDGAVINATGDAVISTNQGQFYLPERAVLPWDLNLGAAVELGEDPENHAWVSDRDVAQRWELGVRLRMIQREDELAAALANAPDAEARKVLTQYYAKLQEADEAEIDAARLAAYWTLQRKMALAPRRHVLLAASVLVSGQADSAVGIESFVNQEVNRSGQSLSVSPRLGAEMEVLPGWLRLRSGTYLEPTRFETSTSRPHYTGGLDVRAIRWNVFGLWPDDYLWRLGLGMDLSRNYSSVSVTVAGWYPRHRGW
jgi:hypothetical protein